MEKIAPNVWKIRADSNIYIVEDDKLIVIDTGPSVYKRKVLDELKGSFDPANVEIVIFTHLHYDHAGNFDLFPNAKLLASRDAIRSLLDDSADAVLEPELGLALEKAGIKPIDGEKLPIVVLDTPGHTSGSICLYYPKQKILFSGDTFFGHDSFGRVDLPTSVPEKMEESISMLYSLDYDILAPGHDYG